MRITAAVTKAKGERFVLEEVELDEPQNGEILLRIVASGICHTDEAVQHQFIPTPLPAVLGHEGAGIVEKVGPGVTEFKKSVSPMLSAMNVQTAEKLDILSAKASIE